MTGGAREADVRFRVADTSPADGLLSGLELEAAAAALPGVAGGPALLAAVGGGGSTEDLSRDEFEEWFAEWHSRGLLDDRARVQDQAVCWGVWTRAILGHSC